MYLFWVADGVLDCPSCVFLFVGLSAVSQSCIGTQRIVACCLTNGAECYDEQSHGRYLCWNIKYVWFVCTVSASYSRVKLFFLSFCIFIPPYLCTSSPFPIFAYIRRSFPCYYKSNYKVYAYIVKHNYVLGGMLFNVYKVQLRVSASNVGHLQVVQWKLINQLYLHL